MLSTTPDICNERYGNTFAGTSVRWPPPVGWWPNLILAVPSGGHPLGGLSRWGAPARRLPSVYGKLKPITSACTYLNGCRSWTDWRISKIFSPVDRGRAQLSSVVVKYLKLWRAVAGSSKRWKIFSHSGFANIRWSCLLTYDPVS